MKRIVIICILILMSNLYVLASESESLVKSQEIQNRIDKIAFKILNANKIDKRVVFVCDKDKKFKFISGNETLTKRQVIVYRSVYKSIETDDELAAYVAREIPCAIRSYDGLGKGWLSSAKIKAAPKKYELIFDKMAVDYMVKAGYNPIGLIILINKTCPQKRQDFISNTNLTSKRLAYIYEYIYTKYPYFLVNNTYLNNDYYQNFLLNSISNRKLLEQKIKGNYGYKIKYE